MTDATTGPGAEGAPRDGKARGRATFPATPPGHDPVTDPPTASRRGEPGTGTDAASGADPTRGSEPGAADDTARGGPTAPFGGDTFPGRETAPDEAAGRTTGGAPAPGTTAQSGREPGADATRDREPASGADTARGDTARGGAGPRAGEPLTGRESGRGGETGRAGGLGGETAAGRDSVPDTAGTRDTPATTTPDLAATREPAGTRTHGDSAAARGREATGAEAGDGAGAHGSRLLPRDECDKLAQELQHAVAGFVDGPRDSVAEADHVLEEAAARFTEAVTQRRRTLRRSWQTTDGGAEGKPATSADTEQLRLALRDYRELADRLLHL
jgi:hypothetical protein